MTLTTKMDRHRPRHTWYLADAQILVRQLQAIAWPLGYHIALGGRVLSHGYSDKDLDLYVLPIYNVPGIIVDELTMLMALVQPIARLDDYEPVSSLQDNPHECFKYAIRVIMKGKPVELFVVRRSSAGEWE